MIKQGMRVEKKNKWILLAIASCDFG